MNATTPAFRPYTASDFAEGFTIDMTATLGDNGQPLLSPATCQELLRDNTECLWTYGRRPGNTAKTTTKVKPHLRAGQRTPEQHAAAIASLVEFYTTHESDEVSPFDLEG